MGLSCTTVQWRGLTLSSDVSSPYGVRNVSGWDENPDSVYGAPKRPRRHGRFATAPTSDERIVTVTGQIVSADRDALLAELASGLAPSDHGDAPEELTITRAGRTLTAFAYITAFRTPSDLDWSVGRVPFGIEWRCPDPLRYGPVASASTGFPERTGGLRWPMFSDGAGNNVGATDWGDVGSSGRAVVSNTGSAASWPQFQVAGPVPSEGFDVVTTGSGARLRFVGAVPAGSSLVIDTATGLVLMDGKYDRVLAVSQPEPVLPGATAEYEFVNRGARSDAVLTASVRPAYW